MVKSDNASVPITTEDVGSLMDPIPGWLQHVNLQCVGLNRDDYKSVMMCSWQTDVLEYLGDSDGQE